MKLGFPFMAKRSWLIHPRGSRSYAKACHVLLINESTKHIIEIIYRQSHLHAVWRRKYFRLAGVGIFRGSERRRCPVDILPTLQFNPHAPVVVYLGTVTSAALATVRRAVMVGAYRN